MRATALPQACHVRIVDAHPPQLDRAAWTTPRFPPSVRRLIISSSGGAVGHPVRGLRATVTLAARRGDRTPSASPPPTLGRRRRRPDERHPDARQPRLDRAGRDDGQLHARRAGSQPPRRRHVPVRHARLHRRPARPAAEAAHADRHRHPHRVPPLPRHGPQDRPRRRRPAARGHALAAPRPVGPAGARRRALAGLGARGHRRAVPPGAVRRVQPAALARAGARPTRPRSTRSTRRPRPRCTGCSPYTGSSRTCRRPSTCGPSTGSSSAAPRTRPGRWRGR